jgi:hypothetical protein
MSNPSSDSYRNPLRYQGQDYSFAPRFYRPRDPLPPQNASTDIKPKENQGYYPLASFWSNSKNGNLWVLTEIVNNLANWVLIGTSHGSLLTLSDNINTIVDPSGTGNIQFSGQLNEQGGAVPSPFQTIISNPANHSISINPMSSSRWLVDPLGALDPLRPNGTHTTIVAAMASAVAGDTIFVMPGTYIGNIVMTPGVNISAYTCDSYTPNVIIQGLVSLTSAGRCTISGISIQTAGNFCVSVTGSAASILNLVNCNIIGVSNSSIQLSSSSASAAINLYTCTGDIQTVGHDFFQISGAGALSIYDSEIINSGSSLSPSTITSGSCFIFSSDVNFPISISGTGGFLGYYSNFTTNTGIPAISDSSSSPFCGIEGCSIASIGAPDIEIGSGASFIVNKASLYSTATFAVDGIAGSFGTLVGNTIIFTGTTSLINPSLLTSAYEFGLNGTWTPIVDIGGSATAMSLQYGEYCLLGGVCTFWGAVQLSSKNALTGQVTVSPLPFASNANGSNQVICVSEYGGVTIANMSTVGIQFGTSSTIGAFVVSFNNGSSARTMADTDISNTALFKFSGSFKII